MAERKQIDPNLLLIGGGAALFYFGILDPVLKAVGLKDDAEDKANDQNITTAKNIVGWNPTYYRQNRGKGWKTFTDESAVFLADEIKESFGFFNDNEERIFAAFRFIADHFQLSQVADAYATKYKADLLASLLDALSDKEFLYIATLVNKLPPYRK